MTEKTVAELSLTKERREATKFGVAIFITDERNRVLVVKEKTSKPETHRNAGEYGVVCETRDPGEGYTANLMRAFKEELKIPPEKFKDIFDFSDRAIWETGFVDKVWATAVVVRCKDPKLLLKEAKPSDEIEIVGWKTLGELNKLSPVREGVRNILDKFGDQIFGK